MSQLTIALDAMGGDHGLVVVVPAALRALATHPDLHLILVGDKEQLQAHLGADNNYGDRLIVHHASQVVAMDESPSHALRGKKDSSMRVAINLVKNKTAAACVSAGNTGALMATARFVLRTLPGIDRPAIISELPTTTGSRARMLDLGANVDSCAEHLVQFAVMGSVLTTAVDGIAKPRVGLLNVGVEEIKGNDQVKRTAQLLSENELVNYIGYVEGDTLYRGGVDVVVCDGFVGNASLKTGEGVAKLILYYLKQSFQRNIWTRALALLVRPILRSLKSKVDPGQYNGASFIGLQGIVIKSHGSANVEAFCNAINEAVMEVKNDVPQVVREQVAKLLQKGQDA